MTMFCLMSIGMHVKDGSFDGVKSLRIEADWIWISWISIFMFPSHFHLLGWKWIDFVRIQFSSRFYPTKLIREVFTKYQNNCLQSKLKTDHL